MEGARKLIYDENSFFIKEFYAMKGHENHGLERYYLWFGIVLKS
jgi:hypothetical protein